jgi:sugar phosphate isomerase/epimerase
MIYVSSTAATSKNIGKAVEELAKYGIRNIELTGGTNYYVGYEKELLKLQDKYNLNYLVHNYFPPPQNHFVLNLASLNDEIYNKSIQHCREAITLSRLLGGNKYGFHAGFLIDIQLEQLGKRVDFRPIVNRIPSIQRFTEAWRILVDEAEDSPKLFIENNVYSESNKKEFHDNNPFLFLNYNGFIELREHIDFSPLLDLAHLKVSARSLELDFFLESEKLAPLTNYFHVSENDGYTDQNNGIESDGDIAQVLQMHNFQDATITLEIYAGISSAISSLALVEHLIESRDGN